MKHYVTCAAQYRTNTNGLKRVNQNLSLQHSEYDIARSILTLQDLYTQPSRDLSCVVIIRTTLS